VVTYSGEPQCWPGLPTIFDNFFIISTIGRMKDSHAVVFGSGACTDGQWVS